MAFCAAAQHVIGDIRCKCKFLGVPNSHNTRVRVICALRNSGQIELSTAHRRFFVRAQLQAVLAIIVLLCALAQIIVAVGTKRAWRGSEFSMFVVTVAKAFFGAACLEGGWLMSPREGVVMVALFFTWLLFAGFVVVIEDVGQQCEPVPIGKSH